MNPGAIARAFAAALDIARALMARRKTRRMDAPIITTEELQQSQQRASDWHRRHEESKRGSRN